MTHWVLLLILLPAPLTDGGWLDAKLQLATYSTREECRAEAAKLKATEFRGKSRIAGTVCALTTTN